MNNKQAEHGSEGKNTDERLSCQHEQESHIYIDGQRWLNMYSLWVLQVDSDRLDNLHTGYLPVHGAARLTVTELW